MKMNWLWAFIIIPATTVCASDRCDTATVLTQIRPGAAWSLHGDAMKGLKWLDTKQSKPSVSEIEKGRKACVTEVESREKRKAQARLDVKNPAIPVEKKVEQLILLLDLDK